ncbi:MAG: hypothetical protein MJ211_14720 [Bacteroidales bacterium]|nr:hypothetical protein [Bacteroidales bacterium]
MKTKLFLAAAALICAVSTVNAQEAEASYEFKSAVISTKADMMGQPMITKYYIDDYGKKQATEMDMNFGGNAMHIIAVKQADGSTISYDLNTKEGRKEVQANVNFLNITPEVTKKYKIKELGEELCQDKPCKVYSLEIEQMGMAVGQKVWIWKGFALKTEIDGGMFTMVTEVSELNLDAEIDQKIFEIPADVKVR